MRHSLIAVLILLLPSFAFAAPPQGPQKTANDTCLKLSANLLQNLQNGNFKAATAHFDRKITAAVTPQKIQQAWQQTLPHIFGDFERAAAPKEIRKGKASVVVTPLQFINSWGKMTVACNTKGQIAHWYIGPGAAPPGAAPNATAVRAAAISTAYMAAVAVNANSVPLTIKLDGFVLKGVLDLPAGKGPFGVVDIIPGSGSVDINGNAGPIQYSMYKKIAAVLVKAGWAVARVAKRYMPPSTGNASHYEFGGQIADNLAIVEALRKNPHINPKRIVVAGHSIGGLIAPKLATETHLAGLILLEAPGESMTKITTAQVLEMNPGASATQRAAIKKVQEGFYQKVAQTPPGKSLSYAGKENSAQTVQLIKSWYAQKPLATASKVKIPVLVVQGGLDFNTPPGNGKRLIKALPHGKLLYLPKMGHVLDVASCRCEKQLDTGKDAKLAPGLAEGIIRWLKTL